MNNDWISVEDRLPEDYQRVLVWEDYTSLGKVYQGIEIYYYRCHIGFVDRLDDDDPYGYITHWMPAPAAPSEPPNLVPVGVTGNMPGTTGFTMACFEAEKVPAGTQLYMRIK